MWGRTFVDMTVIHFKLYLISKILYFMETKYHSLVLLYSSLWQTGNVFLFSEYGSIRGIMNYSKNYWVLHLYSGNAKCISRFSWKSLVDHPFLREWLQQHNLTSFYRVTIGVATISITEVWSKHDCYRETYTRCRIWNLLQDFCQ